MVNIFQDIGLLLKLGSTVAAATFGILGVGAKTRDDEGRLTRRGRIALTGIITAGVLALSTTMYEYLRSQKAARAERERAEKLMLSVERGIYPMRGLTVTFDLEIAGGSREFAALKKTIRSAVERNRSCTPPVTNYSCSGYDADGASQYRITSTSSLFPDTSSMAARVLRSISLTSTFYGERERDADRIASYIGSFFVSFWKSLPPESYLTYDYSNDVLLFSAERHPIDDQVVRSAGIHSLVDFMPGWMAISLDLADSLCDSLGLSGDSCTSLMDPITLTLNEVEFLLPYPKALRAVQPRAVRCNTRQGSHLVQRMPRDVAALDGLGNIENVDWDDFNRGICEVLKATAEVPVRLGVAS